MASFRVLWKFAWLSFLAALNDVVGNEAFSPSADIVLVGGESSTSAPLTQISYSDLFDLFGDVDLDETNDTHGDGGIDRDKTEEILVGILQKRHEMIPPLLRKIERAFGTTGTKTTIAPPSLGFLEVTNIPSEMADLRRKLLPRASKLANLPAEELEALEKPETGYSIGWSHGRESFREETDGGTPKRRYDTAKGSFYMDPFAGVAGEAGTPKNNVYPPSLQPQLEDDLLRMTRFMSRVGLWIAILCDLFLDANKSYDDQDRNERMVGDDGGGDANHRREGECISQEIGTRYDGDGVGDSENDITVASSISSNQWMVYKSLKHGRPAAKARLLYYFPQGQQKNSEHDQKEETLKGNGGDVVYDDWCGWHTDHGSLTALLPGMLCNDGDDDRTKPMSASLHPRPGLYIKTKTSAIAKDDDEADSGTEQMRPQEQLVHVDLAPTSLGFQLGETLQIMSDGKFRATPHAVKAPPSSAAHVLVGRASLAVFLQPLASQVLPPLETKAIGDREEKDDPEGGDDDEFSLQKRWRGTFGEFQRVTIESFG